MRMESRLQYDSLYIYPIFVGKKETISGGILAASSLREKAVEGIWLPSGIVASAK